MRAGDVKLIDECCVKMAHLPIYNQRLVIQLVVQLLKNCCPHTIFAVFCDCNKEKFLVYTLLECNHKTYMAPIKRFHVSHITQQKHLGCGSPEPSFRRTQAYQSTPQCLLDDHRR